MRGVHVRTPGRRAWLHLPVSRASFHLAGAIASRDREPCRSAAEPHSLGISAFGLRPMTMFPDAPGDIVLTDESSAAADASAELRALALR